MATDRDTEEKVNGRWGLREDYRGPPVHRQLLANEFAEAQQQAVATRAALRRTLRHAGRAVPYYRELLSERGVWLRELRDTSALARLPTLDKATVVGHAEALTADYPRPGQLRGGTTQTAGTTGQPTIVAQSQQSQALFGWLKQRELRWFRVDPRQTMLSIRPSVDFPRQPDGNYLADGRLRDYRGWPYVGTLFATGRAWAYNTTNPVGEQAAVMARLSPGFLVMQASCLENLSLQALAASARRNLTAAQAISQTLTTAMREAIENSLAVPVQQNYGLNEIGLVASRCPEGGRYHVHTELCHVELLREDDTVATPGEYGRLVITALQNSIMPLIRYDTGDLALVVDGPCACGRTLPGFGEVLGRYRRLAYLPEGSYKRFSDIHLALYEFAEKQKSILHKFQVYEYRSGAFEVRIDCRREHFESLADIVRRAYLTAYAANPAPPLEVLHTSDFHGVGLTKFQIFLSEFFPGPDRDRR